MSDGRRLGWALALVSAAQFVLQLDFSIVNVALPTIQSALPETGKYRSPHEVMPLKPPDFDQWFTASAGIEPGGSRFTLRQDAGSLWLPSGRLIANQPITVPDPDKYAFTQTVPPGRYSVGLLLRLPGRRRHGLFYRRPDDAYPGRPGNPRHRRWKLDGDPLRGCL
jgi:hypothetical protein